MLPGRDDRPRRTVRGQGMQRRIARREHSGDCERRLRRGRRPHQRLAADARQNLARAEAEARMSLPEFRVLRPRQLSEAIDLLDRHRGEIQAIAGGTDLLPSLKQKLFAPRYLLDLKSLAELRYIRNGTRLDIGALATVASLAASAEIRRNSPLLAEAAQTIASPVLRNMGTLGGNLCLDTRCLWYNQSQFWRESCGYCLKKDGSGCHAAPAGPFSCAVYSAPPTPPFPPPPPQ